MSVVIYEESYDVDSISSAKHSRQNSPDTAIVSHSDNDINFNESLPIQADDDMNISVRSASIELDLDGSEPDMPTRGRSRNKTIEIYSDVTPSHNWRRCGRCYRLCCFSAAGIKIIILLNTVMILLNSALIFYEIMLIIQHESVWHADLPLWYMLCDFVITSILFIEMLFAIGAIHNCNLCQYFKSGWEAWIDILVLLLSIGCCAAYFVFDLRHNQNIDNVTMLFVRVIRDSIRIMRCLWFFKMLYTQIMLLGIREHTMLSAELLANKAWNNRYKLQIHSSPQSTCSDQREYKGPKRVDIYHENDIHESILMHKSDRKNVRMRMYSKTPSPPQARRTTPHICNAKLHKKRIKNESRHLKNDSYSNTSHPSHKRNITRNCDEFRLHLEDEGIIVSDDKSVLSINSQIISKINPSASVVHHRQTNTQFMKTNDSYEAESVLSGVTDGSYWDNLKLRHIQKRSVDKQRLKDLLRNLPSGSILDRRSFSVECDDKGTVSNQQHYLLHNENDEITFI